MPADKLSSHIDRIATPSGHMLVIGSNGALTGYGGGLPRKRWLLNHEAAAQPVLI